MNNLEEKMRELDEKIALLDRRLRDQEARNAIAGLMGRYAFYTAAGLGERIVEELWTKSDGVCLEYGASGIYEGLWKIKTYYIKEAVPGRLTTLAFSTPIFKICEDGRTARGLWTAFCTETDAGDLGSDPPKEQDTRRILLSSSTEEGKRYRAELLLQKYEVEFVLEEGSWKIHKLHVGEFFRCPFDRDWVLYAKERFETDGMWLESLFETPMILPPESHGENLPSGETTWHWQYRTDEVPALLPAILPGE